MTCIVGLEHDGKVWIGGDSATFRAGDLALRITEDAKIFSIKDIIFGSAGSLRVNQLVRFSLKIPPQKVKDDHRYLCTSFMDAFRKCLSDGGSIGAEEHGEEEIESNFLVGYRGHLYRIETDYNVQIPKIGFDACGSGEDYALGSLFSTQNSKLSPEERLTLAMEAAACFSASVSPPFSMLISKKYQL
jgi:ATP-dependent protease HslVU (ClpYQ) peptidase subunit